MLPGHRRFARKNFLEQSIYLEKWLAKIRNHDGIIFSNYTKGTTTQRITNRVIAAAQRHAIITVADPKPKHSIQFTGIDLIKPNKLEALEMLDIKDYCDLFNASDVCHSILPKMVKLLGRCQVMRGKCSMCQERVIRQLHF
jgi:bifunctional ADP-heptose synthase (sugar kinase/adenylyltransferase)